MIEKITFILESDYSGYFFNFVIKFATKVALRTSSRFTKGKKNCQKVKNSTKRLFL